VVSALGSCVVSYVTVLSTSGPVSSVRDDMVAPWIAG